MITNFTIKPIHKNNKRIDWLNGGTIEYLNN